MIQHATEDDMIQGNRALVEIAHRTSITEEAKGAIARGGPSLRDGSPVDNRRSPEKNGQKKARPEVALTKFGDLFPSTKKSASESRTGSITTRLA